MNDQERGKVFENAGTGQFQFESPQVEQPPVQQVQEVEKPKDKRKMILRAIIGVAILAVIGVVAFLIISSSRNRDRVILELGEFSFRESDVQGYVDAMKNHMDNNPGTSFGDDLRLVAIEDLTFNTALKYYASPERCNIYVGADDIVRINNITIPGEGWTEEALLDARWGEFSKTNFSRVRFENRAYKDMLADCVIVERDIFMVRALYYAGYFINLPDDEVEAAYDSVLERLQTEFVPMFEQGLATSEIAARTDLDFLSMAPEDVDSDRTLSIFNYQQTIFANTLSVTGNNPFDETEMPSFRGDMNRIESMNERVNGLNEVGDWTGPFISRSGDIAIVRIEARSGGEFNSWDDFFESFNTRRFAGFTNQARNALANSIMEGTFNSVGTAHAAIYGCNHNHLMRVAVRVEDEDGAPVSGVTIRNAGQLWINQTATGSCFWNGTSIEAETGSNGWASVLADCLPTGLTGPFSTRNVIEVSWDEDSFEWSGLVSGAVSSNNPLATFPWHVTFGARLWPGDNALTWEQSRDFVIRLIRTESWELGALSQVSSDNRNCVGTAGSACTRQNPLQVQRGAPIVFRHRVTNFGGSTSPATNWNTTQFVSTNQFGNISNRIMPGLMRNGNIPNGLAGGQHADWMQPAEWVILDMDTLDTAFIPNGTVICQHINFTPEGYPSGQSIEVCARVDGTPPPGGDCVTDCEGHHFCWPVNRCQNLPARDRWNCQSFDSADRARAEAELSSERKSVVGGACGPQGGTSGSCRSVGTFITQARNTSDTAPEQNTWFSSGHSYQRIAEGSYRPAFYMQPECFANTPGSCCSDCGPGCCGSQCRGWNTPSVFQLDRTPDWVNVDDCANGVCNDDESNPVWARPGDRIEFQHTNDKTGWRSIASRGSRRDFDETERVLIDVVWEPGIWAWASINRCDSLPQGWCNWNSCSWFMGRLECWQNMGNWRNVYEDRPIVVSRLLRNNSIRASDKPESCIINGNERNSEPGFNPTNPILPFMGMPAPVTSVSCNGVNAGTAFVLWSPSGGTTSDGGYEVAGGLDRSDNRTGIGFRSEVEIGNAPDVGTTWRQEMTTDSTWACETNFEADGYQNPTCVSGCGSCPASRVSWFGSTDVEVEGGGSSSAVVKTPFNYRTEAITTFSGMGGENTPGVSILIESGIEVLPRENPIVSTEEYATITHPTEWRLVKFLVEPGNTTRRGEGYPTDHDLPNEGSLADMCGLGSGRGYFGGATRYTFNGAETSCVEIASGRDVFNRGGISTGNGGHRGADGNVFRGELYLDDVPPGTQVCYALGVYPASSWGKRGDIQDSEDANRAAMSLESANGLWWFGEPACVTIAKAPTVQFLGAGVRVPGSITTSQTVKSFGASGNARGMLESNQRRIYGSWSQFGVVAGGAVSGMASGSAFGSYGLCSPLDSNCAPSNTIPGLIPTALPQFWSRQTLTNSSPGALGNYRRPLLPNLSTRIGQERPTDLNAPQYTDYRIGCENDISTDLINHCDHRRNLSGGGEIRRGNNNLEREQCVDACIALASQSDGAIRDEIGSCAAAEGANFDYCRQQVINRCVNEGISGVYGVDDRPACQPATRGEVAVHVSDTTMIITGNITYQEDNDGFSSPDDLPQAIIIVNGDLIIEPQVTRIDAWLIVTGTLNTCRGWSIGDGLRGHTFGQGVRATAAPNSNITCNSKLVFNGPVIAGGIVLNRTGGAGVNNRLRTAGCDEGPADQGFINTCHEVGQTVYGRDPLSPHPRGGDNSPYGPFLVSGLTSSTGRRDASGDPAEVFNLRGDAFIWAHGQSLRGGQATTTYVREVPPRF